MGSAVSCADECSAVAAASSVINLSDTLIMRIADGVEVPQEKIESVTCCDLKTIDDAWYEKLKCFDDAHSRAYGLTFKDLNDLITMFENRVRLEPKTCTYNNIIRCYEKNSECPTRCDKEVHQFIDCLDAKRLEKLKIIKEKKDLVDRANRVARFRR